MKAVILAGGFGTRLSEQTEVRPKPMVEIGGQPILWHIMKQLSSHGITEFIVALGYKGQMITEYFVNYTQFSGDCTVNTKVGTIDTRGTASEDWTVHLANTGLNTMTGGRIRRVKDYLDDAPFLMTYGDGVANVDVSALQEFHASHGKRATVTAVQPSARFGALSFNGDLVESFNEKVQSQEAWINGGFFILNPDVIDLIDSDSTSWEQEPVKRLAESGEMAAFKHDGFWQCMDTLRELNILQELWDTGTAPWKTW